MKLLVGLGNPGEEYVHTRHNLGFAVINLLAEHMGIVLKKSRIFKSSTGRNTGSDTILAKPLTFMNLSGQAVNKLITKNEIILSDILVICDDFSIPLGKTRLRMKGSSGGHKGLQSIIEHTGSTEFPRLRMGIGPVPPGMDPSDFVLGRFGRNETETVESMCMDAVNTARRFMECRL